VLIDPPREDRDRVCLGVAERAGLCSLEPAGRGQLQVTLSADGAGGGREVSAICRAARDRAWTAYRAVEEFSSGLGGCRRRALLDHFGDDTPGAPVGRCCDVCDPETIGLPDPTTLTPAKARRSRPADAPPLDPADAGLFERLREWRAGAADGKPAYTVAHNSTLETIASLRPSSVSELAEIRGIGPAFVERYGEQVLALVGES
jgi:superfamily II DNA helicase RecQ